MEGPLKVVVRAVSFFSPIYRVRKVVSKKRIKRINPIRAILLIDSVKYTIGRYFRR